MHEGTGNFDSTYNVNGHLNGGLSESPSPKGSLPIAIVGMSCKFPGDATNLEKFWQLCAEGRSAWSPIPEDRFNRESFFHPQGENYGTSNVLGGHFMKDDVTLFDASFFNFSAEVAASLDPQFRLQLESTYEALESAGLPLSKVAGTPTSVFAGAFFRDYHDSLMRDPETLPRFFMTGNGAAMISNRISHFFDLRGASVTVDTGCSTGLTALHLACQSIRAGEASMSIVGGANVMLNPDMFISMSSLGLLGSEGKSYSFDSRASGYGRGEGIATVILKSLPDAVRDGDPIRAVIRETALNQDGKTVTITSPSKNAQEDLIRMCYRNAGLDPSDTTYVEAHGTGTRTGDPIEAGAIGSVLGQDRMPGKPLLMGSVKSNIGHLEAASGLASVIKVALALENGSIPPSINFKEPNPAIPLDKWNLKIPTKLEPWPSDQAKRASLSNFGYGGTNAHVIMEDTASFLRGWSDKAGQRTDKSVGNATHKNGYSLIGYANGVHDITKNGMNGHIPDDDSMKGDSEKVHITISAKLSLQPSWRIFMLSGKDERATQSLISNLWEHLQVKGQDLDFQDLAYTLGQRRSIFPWLAAAPARNIDELSATLSETSFKSTHSTSVPRIGFAFTGQGAQWFAMGKELLGAYPVFEESIREAEKHLRSFGAEFSLLKELTRDEKSSRVDEPLMSLSMCTAVQVSLVRLLTSWGIHPTAVTGHSSGEVGAAYAAGALNLRQALAIVYFRGVLTQAFVENSKLKGGMLAAGLGMDDIQPYFKDLASGKAVVACVNSPSSVTVSGDLLAVEEVEARLRSDKIFARKLKVAAAFHSHHMELLAEDYRKVLRKEINHTGYFGKVLYASPVTGQRIDGAHELTPEHWVKNMVQPVLFAQSLRSMCMGDATSSAKNTRQSIDTIIEIGPHGALAGPIRQNLTSSELKDYGISYQTCLVRGQDAVKTMQELACSLLTKGYPVDLEAVNFPKEHGELRVIHNLPVYPWNHSVRHFVEPRVNKEYRNRKNPPHELLGSLIKGANTLEPTWRHFIRPTEIPWVRDHLVQSGIVYPGAGCIAMAIEAVRQSRQRMDKDLLGYNLRDIQIMKALVIPETSEGVEVQLALRNCSDKILDANTWQEFHVYSVDGDSTWSEHCRGFISAKFRTSDGYTPTSKQELGKLDIDIGAYSRRVDIKDFFKSLRDVGIHHGPSFQNLISIQTGNRQSLAMFEVADSASMMPAKFQRPHVVHPITLDALFQAAYSAVSIDDAKKMGGTVPRSIKSLYVSHDISSEAGHRFQILSSLHQATRQGFDVSISTIDENATERSPVLQVEGLHYQSVGESLVQDQSTAGDRLCMTIQWERSLDLANSNHLKSSLVLSPDPAETVVIEDLRRATYHIIHDTLAELTKSDIQAFDWHHQKFYEWMKYHDDRAARNELAPQSSKWARSSGGVKQLLFDNVSSRSVNGEMLCRLGKQLIAILRKEVAPLELMLENKLLYTYYENALRVDRSLAQVEKIVKLFAHQNPHGKVLEIGGGTGACTGTALMALGGGDSGGSPRFSQYDFTDVSSGFFEMAREKFGAWGNMINYTKLDIEQDPVAQSFEAGSYDLIIACQVLHATKAMDKTLSNVRKLLKPGGKLLMVETTQDAFDVQLVFGTLPGWWLSEEKERKDSPNMPIDLWQRFLTRNGFSGLDIDVRDCEDAVNYAMSVIVSTAVEQGLHHYPTDVSIVYAQSGCPDDWMTDLKASIQAITSREPSIQALDFVQADGKVCIVVGEIDDVILHGMDSQEFAKVNSLLNQAKGILWVSRGATMECERPEASLHSGLLRTLRLENSIKRYTSLDLDPKQPPWTPAAITAILNVFKAAFNEAQDMSSIEFEYAERDGVIYIPRLNDDVVETNAVVPNAGIIEPEEQPFSESGRELRLEAMTPGMLDSLVFKDDPSSGEDLPDDFVEIKPMAFGLNFRDIMVAMGQLQERIMGFECGGIVTRLGPNATHDFKVGDRVCALTTRGHWANFIRIPWTGIARIPDDMSFEVAASIPMVFVTAYYSLFEIGRLEKGETVLIHAASGGVGQAAIILAKHVGAEIYVTVGTSEKRDFIKTTYGIADDHIFSSRDPSFAADVMIATKGRGVDVVLNSLSGLLLQESWNCVAKLGRFVEIGKRDIQLNKNLEMEPLGRAISFSAIDLIHLGNEKGRVMSRVMSQVLRLLGEKAIETVKPITVFPISELQRAFRTMQAGKHLGKIIIKPNEGDLVKVMPRETSVKMDPSASYLMVGGMGGIGRSITQWVVQRGAKHLIILSRNAATQAKSQSFLSELQNAGCQVVVRNCDIADQKDLARVMEECERDLPPVRGVIQAAMVLQDSVFERMTFNHWQAAIRPKVQGTWNLHNYFSDKLDFFIMLSSMTAVLGNTSQANYAAGGGFQDAFARYRTNKGLPAVSLDLGMVKSVGYVAETAGVRERLEKIGYRPLEEEEVMWLIEAAIRRPLRQQHSAQITTGIAPFDTPDGIAWRNDRRFSGLRKQHHNTLPSHSSSNKSKEGNISLRDLLATTSSQPEAVTLVASAIVKKLSEMFMLSESDIDTSQPMSKYGVDSLVAVELRNWLVARAKVDISIFDILQSASLVALAGSVVGKLGLFREKEA